MLDKPVPASPLEKKVSDFGLSDNTKNTGYFAPNLLIQMKKNCKSIKYKLYYCSFILLFKF